MIDFKGHRVEKDIILTYIRWYLACPLNYLNLEDMMGGREVEVDRSNICHIYPPPNNFMLWRPSSVSR
jgi:putative transposase